jgi:hypothetical protein
MTRAPDFQLAVPRQDPYYANSQFMPSLEFFI